MYKINLNRPKPDTWKQRYRDVLLEFDPSKLTSLVADAETAIFVRLQSLPNGPEAQDERRDIEDAVSALYTIKKEILRFPGPCFDPISGSEESSSPN